MDAIDITDIERIVTVSLYTRTMFFDGDIYFQMDRTHLPLEPRLWRLRDLSSPFRH